jgi:hypothetical protein
MHKTSLCRCYMLERYWFLRHLSKYPASNTSKHVSRTMLYTTEGVITFWFECTGVSQNELAYFSQSFDKPSIVVTELRSIFAQLRKPSYVISI